MSAVVGIVQNSNGVFFAKDSSGSVEVLNIGDNIIENMIVYGDKNNLNTSNIEISIFNKDGNIVLSGQESLLFDNSVIESSNIEESIATENINEALDKTLNTEESQNTEDPEKKDILDEETQAGNEKIKEDGSGADFAARDGNATDINSGLRDAKFQFRSHTFEIKNQFESESLDRLKTIESEPNMSIGYSLPAEPTTPPPPPPITPQNEILAQIPEISINDVTIDEINGFMIFTVSSNMIAGSNITFTYNTNDGSALNGRDYRDVTGTATISAGTSSTTIKVPIVDDYYAENTENFTVTLSSVSPNAHIDDGKGVGTILDNGTSSPSEPNNPHSPNTSNGYDEEDTVYVKLITDDSVNEGNDLVHGIKLVNANGNDVLLHNGQSVTVSLTYTPRAIDGADSSDYTAQTSVTITGSSAGNNTAIITNPTLDDIFTENVEQYTLSVAHITDNSRTFENILNEGSTVTGTISDDAGSATQETVIVKLIALNEAGNPIDANGNEISPNDTTTEYVFVNEVDEENAAQYMALAFESSATEFTRATQLSSQLGSVIVSSVDNNNNPISGTDAESGSDYISLASETVDLGTAFSVTTLDDNIADNAETFSVSIDSYIEPTTGNKYENVTVSGRVTTTIVDNTGEPENGGTPPEDNSEDTVVKLIALDDNGDPIIVNGNYTFANDVNEGSIANYKALAFDSANITFADGSELFNQLGSVEISTVDIGSATGDIDYTSQTTIKVALDTVFSVNTIDDNIADNGEAYNVIINSYVEPTTGDKYENVSTSGTVTTTIIDNTGIPAGSNPPEENSEDTIIKLVACDKDGNVIYEADGKTYTFINNVNEDDAAGYKAVAFDVQKVAIDGYTTNTELDNQLGSVTITSANLTTPDALGLDSATVQSAIDGSQDYVISTQTVALGEVFYVDTLDDYLVDGGEKFEVNIDSYIQPANGDRYENVTYNGTVITTILDTVNDETSNEAVDTVYVQLVTDDTQAEGSTLTHTIKLVDKDGNSVIVPDGETITVTLNYSPYIDGGTKDGAEVEDYTATKTVTITAGNSEQSFTNTASTDFFEESTEYYVASIATVAQTNNTFENILPAMSENEVVGAITNVTQNLTPDNAYVDEDDFSSLSNDNLVGNRQDSDGGTPLDDSDDTITSNPTSLNLTTDLSNSEYTFVFEESLKLNSDVDSDVLVETTGSTQLTSNGATILYNVDGNILTAYTDSGDITGSKVFDIVLSNGNDDSGNDDGYIYTQYENIDHPTSDADDTITMEFGFKIVATNGSDESMVQNFTVTVDDSIPLASNNTYTVNEDTSKFIEISSESFKDGKINLDNGVDAASDVAKDDSINIYDTDKNDIIGTLLNNGDGTLTFTPTANYSGDTAGFTYNVSDSDGDTASGTISLSVIPEADGATIANDSASTSEDTAVTINFNAPVVGDATDKNEIGGTTAGDYPELLGAITLSNIPVGAELYYMDGTTKVIVVATDDIDHQVTIQLSDTDNHVTDLSSDLTMTKDQFESIEVNPNPQDHHDIDIKMSVTEYEVDDKGYILADEDVVGDNGVTTTNSYHIEVEAVTDEISLAFDSDKIDGNDVGTISTDTNTDDTFTYDATLTEGSGNIIDLKQLLSSTTGNSADSLDGSEHRSYTISGLPEGTVVTFGDRTATADESGDVSLSASWSNDTHEDVDFTMTLPTEFSGDVNATITLNVHDTDSDTNETVTTETETVYFKTTVGSVADTATLSIVQPKGSEDAGRTGSNDEDSSMGAATIDAPQNGIPVDIKVKSSDTDGSEYFNVTIDEIPDGASMYVYDTVNSVWVTIDENSANTGSIVIDNSATGTWKLVLDNYDISDGTYTTNTPKYIPVLNSNDNVTLKVSAETVDSDGTTTTTADSAVLDVLIQVKGVADIPVNTTTVTMDRTTDTTDDGDDIYAAVLDESNSGTVMTLDTLYETSDTLSSYDSDGSEVLTIVLTGLGSEFDVSGTGAAFMGGTGETRKWVISVDDLSLVDITTPDSYAGEVDFKVRYITTENDGDSKTSVSEDIVVLVKPVDEATVSGSTEVNEDTMTQVNITLNTDDSNESLETFKILKSDVDGKEFDLFVNGVQLNSDTASSGTDYYELSADDALNNLFVQYNSDLGTSNDNSFDVIYTTSDTATSLSDGNGDLVDLSGDKSVTINLNLHAITDEITIDASNIVATDGDISVDTSSNTERVTINDTGSFTVDVALNASSSDNNDTDTDGSEVVTRLVVEGVPLGISVDGGIFTQTSGGTNLWFVDIDDTPLDGSYTLTFTVNDELYDGTGTENSIKITAYNEDGVGSTVTTATTEMVFIDNIENTTGSVETVDANLALKDYNVVEDTNFTLYDILDITPDDSRDDESYTVNFKVNDNVSVDENSIDNLNTYEENGETVYVLSIPSGSDSDIQTALQSITLIPDANYNANNDQGTDLAIEATLTAFVPNTSITDNDTKNFVDADVTPVTDALDAATIDGNIDEDNSYSFDIKLTTVDDLDANGNFADDGANTDGSDYVVIGDVTLHHSGVNGVLTLLDGTTIVFDDNNTDTTITTSQLTGLVFTPSENLAGTATFTYTAETQEHDADNTEVGGGTINISVNPIADGLDLTNLLANGIEFTDDNANKYTEVTIGSTMIDTDGSESLKTLMLDDIPDGFLVYVGEDGSQTLALNAGDNGTGDNSWSIDIRGGVPKVWIVAPEYWSGSVTDMKVVSYVNDSNSIQRTETNFTLAVTAVASSITIDPTQTFTENYEWTELNINANMTDLDGSETMTLSLVGANTALDATAQFQLSDGTNVDAVFDSSNSTWTLNDIDSNQINNIEISYHEYNDTVDISVLTVDGEDVLETAVTGSFTMDISATTDTGSGDDTILMDGNTDINTGAGSDTITLVGDINLDFTDVNIANIENIETIDLTEGNHNITLSLDDVLDMTDGNNELVIKGDSSDELNLTTDENDDTSKWEKQSETDNGDNTTYVYSDGSSSVTLTVDDQIDTTGM